MGPQAKASKMDIHGNSEAQIVLCGNDLEPQHQSKNKVKKTNTNKQAGINDDGTSKEIHPYESVRAHKSPNAPRHLSTLSELTSV